MKKIAVALITLALSQVALASDMLSYRFELTTDDKASSDIDMSAVLKVATKATHEVSDNSASHRTISMLDISVEPLSIDDNGKVSTHVSFKAFNLKSRTQVDSIVKLGSGQAVVLGDFGDKKIVLKMGTFDSAKAQQAADQFAATAPAALANAATYVVRKASIPRFTPTRVWDDQKFTYIELPKDCGEMPILVALSDDGKTEMLNYQWDGENSRMVVTRLAQHFKLILGEQAVVVDHI